ncbi:hypothetical protein I302_100902 [Kwoniella bestiolae CBS 10118]|uniref:Uncharacterized protein n=1 Tax=Kwoniella bestiolae CBS 10118 TaxID=1296100 RepID=A0A1B9G6G1_9TREE|nr:hypothetical protein I302_04277 [Kwoniella bestiolae CBS 10118]OCF26591.1 hypothetical protein I302_04277 [Kwoniella bestiolae CBS 10118]
MPPSRRRTTGESFDPSLRDLSIREPPPPDFNTATSSTALSPTFRSSITEHNKPNYVYLSPHLPSDKGWLSRTVIPRTDLLRHSTHYGSSNADTSRRYAIQQVKALTNSIINGLETYCGDLKDSARCDTIGYTAGTEDQMARLTQRLADDAVERWCGDCEGIVVPPSVLDEFNEVKQQTQTEGTVGCLIYSKDIQTLRPISPVMSVWNSVTSSLFHNDEVADPIANSQGGSAPTMRLYIGYSPHTDPNETRDALKQVAERLNELSQSTTIKSEDIHGPLRAFGAIRGLSTRAVDQAFLNRFTSCDPVVLGSDSTSVFARRSTY